MQSNERCLLSLSKGEGKRERERERERDRDRWHVVGHRERAHVLRIALASASASSRLPAPLPGPAETPSPCSLLPVKSPTLFRSAKFPTLPSFHPVPPLFPIDPGRSAIAHGRSAARLVSAREAFLHAPRFRLRATNACNDHQRSGREEVGTPCNSMQFRGRETNVRSEHASGGSAAGAGRGGRGGGGRSMNSYTRKSCKKWLSQLCATSRPLNMQFRRGGVEAGAPLVLREVLDFVTPPSRKTANEA